MTVNSFPGIRKEIKIKREKILLKQPILQLRPSKTFHVKMHYELYGIIKKKKK